MPASCRILVPMLLTCLLLLSGCVAGGDVTKPVPTTFIAAPQPAHRLVVILPGRGDSLQGLTDTGIAEIIQQSWPDADVLLTGLTMPFYRQGRAAQRLHDEVIEPAQRPAYRQIWLAGISLGGLGALLYDIAYPDQIDGLMLLSPYLGDDAIHQQIRQAGGLAAWQAGPAQPIGPDTFQHELWRSLQHWSQRPQRARSTWLAYGADEPFRQPIELMSPLLPADHVLMLPGKHNWKLWKPAMRELLQRAGAEDPRSTFQRGAGE
ncbi:alpha/beta hydrolase-fold protein [Rhodanobacter sp. AS-Z3]|uniref:alpha/beta hydrolase-fold protein n=1 Tax=Rhodanobacter sp. AS-Z3 TaxID=3031330 RepID=UPI002478B7A5|nr:alpha/beta hydrolase-fold protein [Rhodanobacter sp. AS-Z3]WEN14016.1 alpha/beta hydrolase-fold protein [Rhodanobacter sp. AS-Z3]